MDVESKFLYIVYETTNLITNKIYIGAHKTKDIDSDNYHGSGTLIRASIIKHGLNNFSRKVLYIYHSEKVAYLREKYLVNKDFISRSDTYNLKLGGIGGASPEASRLATEASFTSMFKLHGNICGQFHTPERRLKSEETKRLNYGIGNGQTKTKEALSNRSNTLRNKFLYNNPEALTKCKLEDKEGNIIYEGTAMSINSFMNKDHSGKGNFRNILNYLTKNIKIKRGKWKDHLILPIE